MDSYPPVPVTQIVDHKSQASTRSAASPCTLGLRYAFTAFGFAHFYAGRKAEGLLSAHPDSFDICCSQQVQNSMPLCQQ